MIEKYEKIIKSKSGVIFVKGRPGEGKTAILESIAKKNNWKYFDIRLSQIDSAEIIGIPRSHNGVMVYDLPEWAVMANQQPSLIVFEELNRASEETRKAALQVLLERRIGYKFNFNDDVHFASTGNLGADDDCTVDEFDAALNNRLVHFNHTLTLQEWIDNYAAANVHPLIIEFLNINPGYTYRRENNESAFATYRSWTHLSKLIGKEAEASEVLETAKNYAIHYVGSSALKLCNYLTDVCKMDINDIINDFKKYEAEIKKLERFRIAELLDKATNLDITVFEKHQIKNFVSFLKLVDSDSVVGFFTKILKTKPQVSKSPVLREISSSFKTELNRVLATFA